MKNAIFLFIPIFAFAALFVFGCTTPAMEAKQEIKEEPAGVAVKPTEEIKTLPEPLPGNNETITASATNVIPAVKASVPETSDTRFTVYYFYSPLCWACKTIRPKSEEIEERFNASVKFIRYNVLDAHDLEIYNDFTAKYNATRVVPLAFVGNTTLTGIFEINDSLEESILNNTGADDENTKV